jgi:hypothetical protein
MVPCWSGADKGTMASQKTDLIVSEDDVASLATIQGAVRQVLRSKGHVDIDGGRIRLEFDGGIVVTCGHCHISWRVGRGHYGKLAWWSCPSGCR